MSDQPNVVWITLDSVRMDHTTMGGHTRDTTPNISELADSGFSHDTCITPGQGTPYSSGSFLTGTYPFHHGLQLENEYLPEELATVPELLRGVGYRTAGLSRNSFVSPGTGLDRGFDRFEWLNSTRLFNIVPTSVLLKWALNIRQHSAGFTLDAGKHSTPFLMNGIAKRWLNDLSESEPFFLYLHYNEPHHPYYPPLPYLDEYTDDIAFSTEEAASFAMEMHAKYRSWVANDKDLTEEELEALRALYDAEIRYTDEMIGRLFDYTQSLDLEDTVFVITSDHGDFFGEKNLLSHVLSIDDGVTHTPLVVHGLEEIRTDSPVIQQIDVMEALVAEAGGETEQFQGIDIRKETREFAISNRAPIDEETWKEYNSEFDASRFHSGKLTSIHTGKFRYQYSTDKSELFRLPDENHDLSDVFPNVADHLDRKLEEWLSEFGKPVKTTEQSELTNEMQQQLRDLGYVE
ncbi:sulfatase [Haloparvum sp. AD34]